MTEESKNLVVFVSDAQFSGQFVYTTVFQNNSQMDTLLIAR